LTYRGDDENIEEEKFVRQSLENKLKPVPYFTRLKEIGWAI